MALEPSVEYGKQTSDGQCSQSLSEGRGRTGLTWVADSTEVSDLKADTHPARIIATSSTASFSPTTLDDQLAAISPQSQNPASGSDKDFWLKWSPLFSSWLRSMKPRSLATYTANALTVIVISAHLDRLTRT
jgi:hypothetical protein